MRLFLSRFKPRGRFSVGWRLLLGVLLLAGCRSSDLTAQRLQAVFKSQSAQVPESAPPAPAPMTAAIAQFDFASDFSEGLAAVKIGDRYAYRTHLRSQEGAARRFSISLTKQRLGMGAKQRSVALH